MPFIQALGYNVFDLNDVVPEFTASTGNHKDAKADFALLKNGVPFAVIECKPLGTDLNIYKTQLEWYFHNSTARIGILTDGNRYIFYSDLEEKHVMDKIPYLDFTLSKFDEDLFPRIKLLTKDKFVEDEYLEKARQYKYIREFKKMIGQQFLEPDVEFSKFFISSIYAGKKIMPSVLNKYVHLLKIAFEQFLNDEINKRLRGAIKENQSESESDFSVESKNLQDNDKNDNNDNNDLPSTLDINHVENEDNKKVVTTKEEIEAFEIIKNILKDTIGNNKVTYKDCVKSFSIRLNDNQKNSIILLFLNRLPWKIKLFDNNKEKIQIENLNDLYKYADRIISIASGYINKN